MNKSKIQQLLEERQLLGGNPIPAEKKVEVKSEIVNPIQKMAQKSPLIKEKRYWDVKLDTMIPALLTYRVLAEDAAQAASLIKGMSPIGIKHRIVGKKDLKISVYQAGTTMLEWVKNMAGW